MQLRRDNNICLIKRKITPEHNVRSKQYNVSVTVDEGTDEEDGNIVEVVCHDCAAFAGGCNHTVAFLMWLHRRSEEPSPTETTCYWKRSKMSKIGTALKFITLESFNEVKPLDSDEESEQFLEKVLALVISTGIVQ